MASRKDPEDALIRKVMREEGVEKGEAIARLKHRKQIRQVGRHLEPTSRGRKNVRKGRSAKR